MTIQEDLSAEEMQEACILPRIIFIRATMSGILYQLLPFALLKENPLVEVQQYIKEMGNVNTQDGAMLRCAWNKPFNDVSSDAIYFVSAWNSVPEATPRIVKAAGMTFVIGSCGPHHRRWLTTRPMVLDSGELVAWCIEIDMHAVQFERVVTLSEENMIRLVPGMHLSRDKVA